MVVGTIAESCDVVVIGAGPGGYAAALRAADNGADVVLVEKGAIGGTCLNVGCIPSKALIEVANSAYHAQNTPGITAAIDVDMAEVHAHLESVTQSLRSGINSLLKAAGVRVISGSAAFASPYQLGITDGANLGYLDFSKAIIATGSAPIVLKNLAGDARVLDSTGALALTELPKKMTVVGGGYIGIELGTAFAKLGSQVTIVEASQRVLETLPPAIGRIVQKQLKSLGIELLVKTKASSMCDAGLVVEAQDGSESVIETDAVVVAVGRYPLTGDLGLDLANISTNERGYIAVDETCRVLGSKHIFAIGDVVEGPALAHRATAMAEVAAEAIANRPTAFDPTVIPAVVFSEPEAISVGIDPDQAKADGLLVHRFPHAASGRAQAGGVPNGVTLLITDEHETILGAHICGLHASELAGEAALAIEMAATLQDLTLSIHPHPTISETLVEAGLLALGHPLHIRK